MLHSVLVLHSVLSYTVMTSTPLRSCMAPPTPRMAQPLMRDAIELLGLEVGAGGSTTRKCNLRFKPVLPTSEAVVVRYKVPFGLNVESKNGMAVCTKDGEGGERVGDVLRYCTEWKMGLPSGDGAITTAASFAGAISWQMGLFDVLKASAWDEVVEALVSNTEERTEMVTLVFERPTAE